MRYFQTALLSVLVVVAGCGMSGRTRPVSCVLPEVPASWDGRSWADGCRVVSVDSAGEVREAVSFPASGVLAFDMPAGSSLPVLAYPSGGVVPAGGILPWDLDEEGRLVLSWEHGWSALLLFRLSSAGGVSDALNVRRLNEEVLLKAGGDPWALNMQYALRSLSYGRFHVYGLSLLPVHEPAVPAAPGEWFSDNPFCAPVLSGPDGFLAVGPIGEGFHRYRSSGGEVIDIHVTDLGWRWINRLSGDAGYGTW